MSNSESCRNKQLVYVNPSTVAGTRYKQLGGGVAKGAKSQHWGKMRRCGTRGERTDSKSDNKKDTKDKDKFELLYKDGRSSGETDWYHHHHPTHSVPMGEQVSSIKGETRRSHPKGRPRFSSRHKVERVFCKESEKVYRGRWGGL